MNFSNQKKIDQTRLLHFQTQEKKRSEDEFFNSIDFRKRNGRRRYLVADKDGEKFVSLSIVREFVRSDRIKKVSFKQTLQCVQHH